MPTVPLRTQVKEAIKTMLLTVEFPTSVNGHSTWVSISRRLRMFNRIDAEAQPCCFLVQHSEVYESKHIGIPARRIMEVGAWCFAPTGNEDVIGDDYLDSMMEGIENSMYIDDVMRNELTFGGLVYSVMIERKSNLFIRDPGDIDGQALLIVPFRIIMP